MTEPTPMISNQPAVEQNQCHFFHFGLLVTGKGEREHLPKLFRSLQETGICTFEVIRFLGQRSPQTSDKKILKMVGSGKIIPSRDEEAIGVPARGYLSNDTCRFVILIDDLEYGRRDQAQQLFDRYRLALNTMLTKEQQHRAAVHFLVNMLEAYYFADAQAVNAVLNLKPPLEDYAEDVETIRHPKNELKKLVSGFKEIEHGGVILDRLDIGHILSLPDHCAALRTLFAWCVGILEKYPYFDDIALGDKFQLADGVMYPITQRQL